MEENWSCRTLAACLEWDCCRFPVPVLPVSPCSVYADPFTPKCCRSLLESGCGSVGASHFTNRMQDRCTADDNTWRSGTLSVTLLFHTPSTLRTSQLREWLQCEASEGATWGEHHGRYPAMVHSETHIPPCLPTDTNALGRQKTGHTNNRHWTTAVLGDHQPRGGRLQPVLMRHPPPAIGQNLGWGGWGGQLGGGGGSAGGSGQGGGGARLGG